MDDVVLGLSPFRIHLARVDAEVESDPTMARLPQIMSGNETILLAEDDPQLRRLCASLLLRLGYTVLEAASAEDAMLLAGDERQRIDMVLTDVIMPGESGSALVSRLFETRPGLCVLYMSGYTGDAVVRPGLLRAELNYLQKPFTPRELAHRVRQVFDAASARGRG